MLKKIQFVLYFIISLWVVEGLDLLFHLNLDRFGIDPRTIKGLRGIIFSPFLHGGFRHLLSNTLPLAVLMSTLLIFYEKIAYQVIIYSTLLGGWLVWALARPSYHIGASGLIYSLASFLIVFGIFTRKVKPLIITVIVFFLYGGIFWGVFPIKPWISWEGHLFGMIAGVIIAYAYRNKNYKKIK